MNFAVLASGRGSNLQAIIDALKKKKIKASLKLVFSNKPDALALTRAQKAKIPTLHLTPKNYASREEFDKAVLECLQKAKIDFIVLAGYMRLLSGHFIRAYEGRILNIHPSLLPAFKGAHAIRDAFEAGVKVTGVSVHFVVEEMDAGPIIAQVPVLITPKDTITSLEHKIHKTEHGLYPKAIDGFARGKLKIHSGKIILR
jgi:phosphoribosylglycinamide formyltransferase-1